MKKVRPSGDQNRKKRARDEEDFQQKGASDAWINKNKQDVGTVKYDVGIAEDSYDIETEDKTVSFQSPFQYTSNLDLKLNTQQCTTHGNAPKGSESYLRPKTHIQHTHP